MTLTLGQTSFAFMLKTDLRFGVGEADKLPDHLRRFHWKNLALIVDSGPARNPAWRRVQTALEHEFAITARLETSVAEPTYDYLDEVRPSFMGKPIDGFVVVGGGSTLDLGKALSVLVTNADPGIEYRGFDLSRKPGPPGVAVRPTAV